MMSKRFLIIPLLLIFLFPCEGYPQKDKELYDRAVETAGRGDIHFAFMYFRMLLRDFSESKYFKDALFAIGEYYFSIGDYYDAQEAFRKFIKDCPESEARPFALAYLFKIAEKQQREDLTEDLKKRILKLKRLVLLFKDFEEYEYSSPLSKKYKAVYFIDRIEIYIDDGLFTKVSF